MCVGYCFILARSVIRSVIFNALFILISMFFLTHILLYKVVINITSSHIISQCLLILVTINFLLVIFTGVFSWNVVSMGPAIVVSMPTFYVRRPLLNFILLIAGAFFLVCLVNILSSIFIDTMSILAVYSFVFSVASYIINMIFCHHIFHYIVVWNGLIWQVLRVLFHFFMILRLLVRWIYHMCAILSFQCGYC